MIKKYRSISLKITLIDKLKMVKGTKSYSKFIEDLVFGKYDKLNDIIKNKEMIKKLAGLMKEIAEAVGKKSSEYHFNPDDWIIEPKKIVSTSILEPKVDYSKLPGFKKASEL